jgi:hypothetical protein
MGQSLRKPIRMRRTQQIFLAAYPYKTSDSALNGGSRDPASLLIGKDDPLDRRFV